MTEAEYEAIAARCDLLLRGRGTSLERIAIPLLHLVSEHPGWISQYAPVLEAERTGHPLPPQNLVADARTAARVTRALWRSFESRALSFGADGRAGGIDVLIVSHLVDPAQLARSEDFYFGDLQQLLEERGVTSALLWVDHLRSSDARSACLERLGDSRRRLLPRSVPLPTEARIWRRCFAAAQSLRREGAGLPPGPSRRARRPGRDRDMGADRLRASLARLASRHVLYEPTVANLRLHESVVACCRRFRPRIVITTHEGDACDRLIWHAARHADPATLCVGYQHTRMLPRAHAIRRSVGVEGLRCDPDVILTVGEFTHAELSKCQQLHSVRLINYGSHRRVDTVASVPFGQRPKVCVVLPDAYEIESALLFDFALECARARPEVSFILRPHPAVDLSALRSRHASLRELPANVRMSSGTLEQDCQTARYCLYRGSSAVVAAVLCGTKPFYLHFAGELRFDPLYALGEWREVVSSTAELLGRIGSADAGVESEADAATRARQLCSRYVSRVRPEALEELLELASARTGTAPRERATAAPVQ